MTIKIVTDSTSDMPPDVAESLGIEVVPLNVHFGADVYQDRVDLMPDRFYDMLINGDVFPTTSQPSVGAFVDVYERLAPGADGIVSVHVSDKLSGTMNSARLAREQAETECPIEVIDTFQASVGVAMVAMEAARVASSGMGLAEVATAARDAIDRYQCVVMFETLEYLQKGGRIGKAQALLGNLLRIRPLITLQEGEVLPFGKERTRRKGIAKLAATASESAPLEVIAVMYSTSRDEAEALAESLTELLETEGAPMILQFGPTLGTYVGPDALGIGLMSAKDGG